MEVGKKKLKDKKLGEVVVISPIGDIDMQESPKLRSVILEEISKKPMTLIIELSGVGFMDSSGIATLVEAMKESKHSGFQLYLCGLKTKVMDVFELARLDKIFKIVPSLHDLIKE